MKKFLISLIMILSAVVLTNPACAATYTRWMQFNVTNKLPVPVSISICRVWHLSDPTGFPDNNDDKACKDFKTVEPGQPFGQVMVFSADAPTNFPQIVMNFYAEKKLIGSYEMVGRNFGTSPYEQTISCSNGVNGIVNKVTNNNGTYSAALNFNANNTANCAYSNNITFNDKTSYGTIINVAVNYQKIAMGGMTINFNNTIATEQGPTKFERSSNDYYPIDPNNAPPLDVINGAPRQFTFSGDMLSSNHPWVIYKLANNPKMGCKISYYRDPDTGFCKIESSSIESSKGLACPAEVVTQGLDDKCIANVYFKPKPPKEFIITTHYENKSDNKGNDKLTYVPDSVIPKPAASYYLPSPNPVDYDVESGQVPPIKPKYCINGTNGTNVPKCNDNTSQTVENPKGGISYYLHLNSSARCDFTYQWKFKIDDEGCSGIATPATKDIECKVTSAVRNKDACAIELAVKSLPSGAGKTIYNLNMKNAATDSKLVMTKLLDNNGNYQTSPPDQINSGSEGTFSNKITDNTTSLDAIDALVAKEGALKACQGSNVPCVGYAVNGDQKAVCMLFYATPGNACKAKIFPVSQGSTYSVQCDVKVPTSSDNTCQAQVTLTPSDKPQVPPAQAQVQVRNATFDQIITTASGMPSPVWQDGNWTSPVSVNIADGNKFAVKYALSNMSNAFCNYEFYYGKDKSGQGNNECRVTATPDAAQTSGVDLNCSATAKLDNTGSAPVCDVKLNMGLN